MRVPIYNGQEIVRYEPMDEYLTNLAACVGESIRKLTHSTSLSGLLMELGYLERKTARAKMELEHAEEDAQS